MTDHGFHYGPCRGGRGGVAGVIIVLVVAGLVARAAVHAVAEALPYILGAVAVTGVLGGVAAAALVARGFGVLFPIAYVASIDVT